MTMLNRILSSGVLGASIAPLACQRIDTITVVVDKVFNEGRATGKNRGLQFVACLHGYWGSGAVLSAGSVSNSANSRRRSSSERSGSKKMLSTSAARSTAAAVLSRCMFQLLAINQRYRSVNADDEDASTARAISSRSSDSIIIATLGYLGSGVVLSVGSMITDWSMSAAISSPSQRTARSTSSGSCHSRRTSMVSRAMPSARSASTRSRAA